MGLRMKILENVSSETQLLFYQKSGNIYLYNFKLKKDFKILGGTKMKGYKKLLKYFSSFFRNSLKRF